MIKLSWYVQAILGMALNLLTVLASKVSPSGVSIGALPEWEQIVIGVSMGTGLSFLMALSPQITNPTEQAELQSAVQLIQSLMAGGDVEAAALASAIAFLQKLLAGQVPSA